MVLCGAIGEALAVTRGAFGCGVVCGCHLHEW
jgi:hypothetical protein